ncbi:sensor histidine kinase [Alicyclobacillus fastidiosus]|uniref:sensor histidine kinase n=1 Tax=Alicyclobacillus fastidiosus TaxID=392011 RepID=UPI0023E940A9|nr:histidine kinase dimerization/phospho-acceptor domain-containing protein [Alicyclobacillus fastidiosus]GMA64320.1 two-component sensor histidine kinase [Alicyclobacillus fastidiosus]
MLTSLFRKTLMVYISVAVIGFTGLSVALNSEIKHFLAQQRLVVLNREVQEMLPYLERATSQQTLDPAFERLVSHDKKVDNTSANILLLGDGSGLKKIQRLTSYLISHDQIRNAREVKRVLDGQRIQFIGPFSTLDREATLTVGLPIRRDGSVVGALFLHTFVKGLQLGQVTRIIFFVAWPILLLSIVILYLTTRRFAQPLVRMTRAVQSFGQGNFRERISVESKDEVGQLAETFNPMAIQLERLESMRKDLIANVSHELRTPLTSVRGFIQGILEDVIPPSQHQKYLATAYSELQRLNAILNSMLDLSAIETGQIQLNLEAVQWATVVKSVRDRVKVRMDEKQIEWKEFYSDKSITIWGDPERLTQILFNILDNAIRHTSTGGFRSQALLSTVNYM